MVNAAGHLRSNESSEVCGGQHSSFGLDGSVTGKKGVTPLGDLATIVCSYDHTAGCKLTSDSYFFIIIIIIIIITLLLSPSYIITS